MTERFITGENSAKEILAFLQDPAERSVLVYNEPRYQYISLVKFPVGKAEFVYAASSYSASFEANVENQYSLEAIVVGEDVYLYSKRLRFFLLGKDVLPCIHTFEDYYSDVQISTAKIFQRWYKSLSVEPIPAKELEKAIRKSMDDVLETFIFQGPEDDQYERGLVHRPLASANDVSHLLAGILDLETHVIAQLEQDRDEYLKDKVIRKEKAKYLQQDADLDDTTKAIANAVRNYDAKTFAIELEHNGIVCTCKVKKPGFLLNLCCETLSDTFDVFCSREEGTKIAKTYTRKPSGRVPLSYISRITHGKKVLYVRDANNKKGAQK